MRQTATRIAGFTLFELMMTITVLGILLGIGVPSFSEVIRNNRTAATANDFITALSLARSEANKRGLPVTVCAASNATTCAAVDADSWANGWLVFTDIAGTAGVIDTDDTIIQTWPGLDNKLTLTSGDLGFVRFGSNGAPTPTTGGITFNMQHNGCSGVNRRVIQLNATGRVALSKQTCS
jgi:type IV fimbrial biogenesis protein FimT